MDNLGLSCPLSFLTSKAQRKKTNIFDLNFDCNVKIFSNVTVLEDKLNLARALPQFREVLLRDAAYSFAKINMRMLRSIYDWEYLLKLCGYCVVECELRHGYWDENVTLPFLNLLNVHCKNLQHLYLIFAHSDVKKGGDLNILQVLQRKDLKSLSLIDATSTDFLQLHKFTELAALHIDGIDVDFTDADFIQLFQALPELRRLSLRFAKRRQFPPLSANCSMLEHLSLENFEGTLDDVGEFPILKSLRLHWRLSVPLNRNLFRTLVNRYMDRLEQLELTKVNPEDVNNIVSLQRLKSLICRMWPSNSLIQITKLKELECLGLQCSESSASLMELLDIVDNCTKLRHLKLGKLWNEQELERFLRSAHDKLLQCGEDRRREQLLVTMEFTTPADVQKELKKKVNSKMLKLDWLGTVCSLCQPDRHNKQTIPGLIFF